MEIPSVGVGVEAPSVGVEAPSSETLSMGAVTGEPSIIISMETPSAEVSVSMEAASLTPYYDDGLQLQNSIRELEAASLTPYYDGIRKLEAEVLSAEVKIGCSRC